MQENKNRQALFKVSVKKVLLSIEFLVGILHIFVKYSFILIRTIVRQVAKDNGGTWWKIPIPIFEDIRHSRDCHQST